MRNTFLGIAGILFIILVFLKLNRPSVEGKWVGEYVIEGVQDTLQIDANKIILDLAEKTYEFESTLNNEESGSYKHAKDFLIITPNDRPAYKMIIKELSADHMELSMTEESSPRLLSLRRSN